MKLKPEHEPKKESLEDYRKRYFKERYGDPAKTQWRVEEWQLPYTEPGYYGQDIPGKLVDYSVWFDSKKEAQASLDKHAPSKPGNKLRLKSRTLYRKWIPGHWQEKWI